MAVVSGLYLSSPFNIVSMCSGRSGAESNATPISVDVKSKDILELDLNRILT